MARRVFGRALLALVLSLNSATLAAPPPATAQARLGPPPVLRTLAPVGTAPAAPCMRRAQMLCRRVQRFVVREGVRTRQWTWACGAAARLRPGPARAWRLVAAPPLQRCRWPR
jgi:hypothetical protein